jgi:CBS domain-containing protein
MNVEQILKTNGRAVETIGPDATVLTAIGQLTRLGIGALVVSADGHKIEGVISERDVVRALLHHGGRVLDVRVGAVMSRGVPVCRPDDTIKHVMAAMTRTRSRHLPVIENDRLCGIVSIGDVVKNRLDEVELEANVLRDRFIAGH